MSKTSSRHVFKTSSRPTNICWEYSEDPLGDALRTSWGCPESISQGRPLNVRFGRPLDGISLHPQGHPDRTSRGRSNRIFRGRPGAAGGGRPRDALGTNICWLGRFSVCWIVGIQFEYLGKCICSKFTRSPEFLGRMNLFISLVKRACVWDKTVWE